MDSRVRPQFLINGKPQTGLWTHSALIPSVCRERFSIPLQAIPKTGLSTFVLDLMIYLTSYELCLMSYPVSYVILSSYDLTALVYVLLLRLRLTISRLVSMYFVLCRFLRILEDISFLSFLRILVLLEEPPHLTADSCRFAAKNSFDIFLLEQDLGYQCRARDHKHRKVSNIKALLPSHN